MGRDCDVTGVCWSVCALLWGVTAVRAGYMDGEIRMGMLSTSRFPEGGPSIQIAVERAVDEGLIGANINFR